MDNKPNDFLKEYIYLNGVPTRKTKEGRVVDHVFPGRPYLFREYKDTVTLYFLESSNTVEFDRIYLDLFMGLDVSMGEQILYSEVTGLGRLDLFIVGFLKFVKMLETKHQEAPEFFLSLCKLGTTEFRRFMSEASRETIGPWRFEGQTKTLEL